VKKAALVLMGALFLAAIVSPGPAEARHWRHWRGGYGASPYAHHPYCDYGESYRCNYPGR
jgi:hypothetical protein